ncbi:MAG: ABC transporter substrate-binding protein [Hyphomicrobiaceae bacterium]
MLHLDRVKFVSIGLSTSVLFGLSAMSVSAQNLGSMHVAFGDIPGPDMTNFMIAVKRAEARGVKVKVSYLQSEDIAAQAVVSGQADIGVGTPYALIQKVKAPIRMFYQLSQLRFYPVVNGKFYKTWKELDGADVGVHGRGSGTEAIMQLMAKKNGIKYRTVSYVPGSAVRAGALMQGRLKVSIVDFERRRLLEKKAPGQFVFLPLPKIEASDEALYANVNWLQKQSKAVDVLMEELLGVWREINADPKSVVALRDKYKVLPNLEKEDVDEILPSFAQGVEINLYPQNGGGASAVKQDFEFYSTSGTLKGDPSTFKVEDFWYFAPLERALAKVGKK